MKTEKLSKKRIWVLAIRPKTLPAAVGPVLVGSAFAFSINKLDIFISIAAILGALFLQILSNLGNDYFDFVKGKDTEERTGPLRVAQSGLLSLRELRNGIGINVVLALAVGLFIVVNSHKFTVYGIPGSLVIMFIGVLSIIFAILYSGGPYPLSSLGLGDLFVLIFFGIIAVNGTYFVNAGELSLAPLIGSFGPGLMITAILVVNNYRDYETDKKTSKKTLVVRFGQQFGKIEYNACILLPYTVPFVLFIAFVNFSYLIFLPVVSIFLAVDAIKRLNLKTPKPELNKLLASTSRLSLFYSILLALGITLGAIQLF